MFQHHPHDRAEHARTHHPRSEHRHSEHRHSEHRHRGDHHHCADERAVRGPFGAFFGGPFGRPPFGDESASFGPFGPGPMGRGRRGPFGGGPLGGGPFGGGPFGPGGPRGGGRGGLGRFFAHGDLRLVLLQLIAEKPRHGYELIKAVEERVAGAYTPSPGVVYPTLTLLEELGYIAGQADEGSKKLYEATAEGRAYLDANRGAVDTLFARMDEASRVHGGGPAPQVIRAMQNLHVALRLRMAHGPLTDEQIQAIAAALDGAASAIERT